MFLAKAALRTIARRRFKSLVVLAISWALVFFINMYTETITKQQAILADLYGNIEVTGYITGPDANQQDDLGIAAHVIEELEESGFIARGLYTRNLRCLTEPWPELEGLQIFNMLRNSPRLVGANDLFAIGAFSFARAALPEYMEGYDEELFSTDERVCIVSDASLASLNLQLGDELQLTVAENPRQISEKYGHGLATLRVVGTYPSRDPSTPVYCPWQVMDDLYQDIGIPLAWDSAGFVLQNTRNLDGFRAFLRTRGFASHSLSGKGDTAEERLGFVIDEGALKDATASVEGYLEFTRVLFPIIYVISVGIGFIVSYLLVRIRKAEFAVMRSLGTSHGGGFLTLFLEQGLLAALGTGLGTLLTIVITGGTGGLKSLAIMGYIVCYLVGTAIAISTLNRVNVIHILTARE